MASVFSRIRRRLDATPLWAIGAVNAGVVAVFLFDVRIPDPFKFMDEIILGSVALGTAIYVWRRFFGPPGVISADARRKVAEIETLFEESRKAAETVPGAGGEVVRLGSLLEKVRVIEQRLEQAEIVLSSPQYDVRGASQEIDRLAAAVAAAPAGHTRTNLEGALSEAKKHIANIAGIEGTRDELSSAFERIYQLVRRIHSQIVGLGLAQGTERDLSVSIDELAKTLAEYEYEQEEQKRAEAIVDREIAEAEAKERARLAGRSEKH